VKTDLQVLKLQISCLQYEASWQQESPFYKLSAVKLPCVTAALDKNMLLSPTEGHFMTYGNGYGKCFSEKNQKL